jgi:hypothetical protein
MAKRAKTKTGKTKTASKRLEGLTQKETPAALQKVSDLGFSPAKLKKAGTRVANLTIRDLDELAVTFAGGEIFNPKVRALDFQDLKNLEELFRDQRDAVLRAVGGMPEGLEGIELLKQISVSCCSCTPCCCCTAATDTHPFDV